MSAKPHRRCRDKRFIERQNFPSSLMPKCLLMMYLIPLIKVTKHPPDSDRALSKKHYPLLPSTK